MSRSRAYQMGIRGRAPKAHPAAGVWLGFTARDGGQWRVVADSGGYFYADVDGAQVTSTSYGYAFNTQGALIKALEGTQ